jgi:hypothetical protein
MKLENDKGEPVEINFQNFEKILPGSQAGFTPIKLKNGQAFDLMQALQHGQVSRSLGA